MDMLFNDKIDLHIHTNFSNGKDDLISVLKQAERNNVKVISITDYNSLLSYIKLKNSIDITNYFTGKIIVGLEVRTRFLVNGQSRNCDMLVYNIDLDKVEEFQKWLEQNTGKDQLYEEQLIQLNHFKIIAKKLGLKYDEDLTIEDLNSKAGYVMINNLLKYYDENIKIWPNLKRYKDNSTTAWIEVFINPSSEFFFDISKYTPRLEDFLQVAHEYGGLVFAAHPFAYISNCESEEKAISELLNYVNTCLAYGVDGVECFNQYNCNIVPYALFASRELLKYCIENNIKISGGTDYHSNNDTRSSGIGILGKENVYNIKTFIPYGIISNWAKPLIIENNGITRKR